ncbi:MAG: ATP-NAD kinase family protein [Deltaproteobacteria bacterium]|nr:ATP-NAD kinase family protein [Deltaproteobacteria bacterium]
MKKLGLIVNPIAGMGGKVGLKGSDGPEILRKAVELGAKPEAPLRAILALERLLPARDRFELLTYPFDMGEEEARACGFEPEVFGTIQKGETTAEDTRRAALEMERLKVDLLLFAGGDGTARDIYSAVRDRIPALGIPTGVKMHSAVYATSPRTAGELARLFIEERTSEIRLVDGEVMDIDEASFRENRVSARLYGYLKVPFKRTMIQSPKAGGCAGGREALDALATEVIREMEEDCLYIIGTGTTTRAVMEKLGLPGTLLGIDAVYNRRLIGSDLNESRILRLMEGRRTKIVVGIIGRQGYIFGRGNQQISARIIQKVGRENIIVIATMEKLLTLEGRPLLVDTGDEELDRKLSGYIRVITGIGERAMLKVKA